MKKLIEIIKDGKIEEVMGCIAITTVIVPVLINIFNRSILNFYSTKLEAIALLAYVWIGYGFFGYGYLKDNHVDVRFIVNKLSPVARKVFDVIRDVLILAFSVYMVYWGCKLFKTNITRYATGTKIPLAVGYASIVFGFFMGTLRSLIALIKRIIHRPKEESENNG